MCECGALAYFSHGCRHGKRGEWNTSTHATGILLREGERERERARFTTPLASLPPENVFIASASSHSPHAHTHKFGTRIYTRGNEKSACFASSVRFGLCLSKKLRIFLLRTLRSFLHCSVADASVRSSHLCSRVFRCSSIDFFFVVTACTPLCRVFTIFSENFGRCIAVCVCVLNKCFSVNIK